MVSTNPSPASEGSRTRWVVAVATAVAVFVLTYLAAWKANSHVPSRKFYLLKYDMNYVRIAVREYSRKNGVHPESLVDLAGIWNEIGMVVTMDESGRPLDPWGNPYQYSRTDGRYRLYSFGPDGKAGGVGVDVDIDSEGPNAMVKNATLRQFLFETDGGDQVFMLALVAGGVAGLIWYVTAPRRRTRVGLAANLAAIVVSALVVSWFLAVLYFVSAQSGH